VFELGSFTALGPCCPQAEDKEESQDVEDSTSSIRKISVVRTGDYVAAKPCREEEEDDDLTELARVQLLPPWRGSAVLGQGADEYANEEGI